jgi:hypothetical protein
MQNNIGALLVVSEDYCFLLINIIVRVVSQVRLSYIVDVVPAFSKIIIRKLAPRTALKLIINLVCLFASIELKLRILSGGGLLSGMIKYGRTLQQ